MSNAWATYDVDCPHCGVLGQRDERHRARRTLRRHLELDHGYDRDAARVAAEKSLPIPDEGLRADTR